MGLVGRWGVGKTHLWKSIVEERKAQLSKKYPRYAYLSLFGLRSISDVRTSILCELSSMAKAGAEPDSVVGKAWAVTKRIVLKRAPKGAHGLGKVAQEAIQLGIDAFEFRTVRNCLICLDDLERMAADLTAIEVMGLVETLARERGCKIVLIFSPDNLSDDSKKSLKQYREKVFDREILLDPPMTYFVDIAAKGRAPATVESLSRIAESLAAKNVRVLRKIMVGYDDVVSHVPELLEPVKDSLMGSLGILYYCHLVGGEDVPSVDDVLRIEYVSEIEEADAENGQAHTKYLQFLRRVRWTHLSETDRYLAAYVRDGLCDWAALGVAFQAENQDVASSTRRKQIEELWHEYRASFRDEEGWRTFATKLRDKYLEHVEVVHTRSLDSALWVLRKVGMQDDADDLLENWRVAHSNEKHMFNLEELETFEKVGDAKLREVCEASYAPSTEKDKDILEILGRIATEKSWGGDDTAFLESAGVDDFVKAFRSNDLTLAAMNGARFYLRLGNPGPEDLVIREKIESALQTVAHDSELNKEKVRALGVSVDDPEAI